MIKELEDIIEGVADRMGLYGDHRQSFTSDIRSRIIDAAPRASDRLPLRGAVALKVLSAWLANPEVFFDEGEEVEMEYYSRMARHAYMVADAFLASTDAPGAPTPMNPKIEEFLNQKRKSK